MTDDMEHEREAALTREDGGPITCPHCEGDLADWATSCADHLANREYRRQRHAERTGEPGARDE